MKRKPEMFKYLDEMSKIRVKCKCGCSNTIPVYLDTKPCSYCGKKLHNNTKLYFKYKVRKVMNNDN